MEFEWDPAKAASNLAKHGIAFELAQDLDWGNALVTRQAVGGEARYAALALSGDRLHFCAYVVRSGVYRIISLRKANRREIRRFAMEN